MITLRALPSLFALVIVACGSPRGESRPGPDSASVAAPLTVSPEGAGPVRIGWSLSQLNAALGEQLKPAYDVNPECDYVDPDALPPGLALMVVQDTIVRVDVDTTGIATAEGAMVGDTEARILELYAGRVEVQPHKYTGPVGHYLVVKASADTMHLIIFETDGHRVLNYRAGIRPAVEYIEGCA
jgi:hypothetical protein